MACPKTPRLDGKLAVVTGGNAGVGFEIGRGLARRGADLVIASRDPVSALAACDSIARETGARPRWVPLDLSDLDSVVRTSDRLHDFARGRCFDIFVAGAVARPRDHEWSAQGHEIAFAVNTLGHHLLARRLLDGGLLEGARVVVLTDDVYIRANECTPDFFYRGPEGGLMAYARSKLGSLWFAAELQRRYPTLEVAVVHPGVIANDLDGELSGFGTSVVRALMIDAAAGAQVPLFCATQPGIVRGGYYHNTMGLVRLRSPDPAADRVRAARLWHRLEGLSFGFREASGRSTADSSRATYLSSVAPGLSTTLTRPRAPQSAKGRGVWPAKIAPRPRPGCLRVGAG